MKIQVEMTDPRVKLAYAHPGDAGFDLQASISEKIILAPGERRLIPCGFKIAIPVGFVGFVNPRSGLALKRGIRVTNAPGTVDAPYRGEVAVILENSGGDYFVVEPLDRIAQMVLLPILTAEFESVESLDQTKRGEGGFGSSGVSA